MRLKLTLHWPTTRKRKFRGKKLLEDLVGSAIYAFANLATATAVDRGIVATLTEANSRLTKQLEYSSQILKEIKALLKKERNDRSSRKTFAPPNDNNCWTRGYKIARNNTSENCLYPKTGHKREANKKNNLGGSQANKQVLVLAALKRNIEKFQACRTPPFYNIRTLQ
jgi:hypothetical protein